MDGVLGRSHANAATSIEAHQPDSLNQHGSILGEQAILTVPFQAPVKSLSVDRPVDAGSTEVRCRHDLARGLAGLFERFHARRINFRSPARFASLGGQPFLIATNARSDVGRLFDDC